MPLAGADGGTVSFLKHARWRGTERTAEWEWLEELQIEMSVMGNRSGSGTMYARRWCWERPVGVQGLYNILGLNLCAPRFVYTHKSTSHDREDAKILGFVYTQNVTNVHKRHKMCIQK